MWLLSSRFGLVPPFPSFWITAGMEKGNNPDSRSVKEIMDAVRKTFDEISWDYAVWWLIRLQYRFLTMWPGLGRFHDTSQMLQ